jgi:hypothetical protein
MTRVALLPVFILLVLASACSSRRSKTDRSELIPEKDLVSILTDLYITDGLITLPKTHQWFPSLDSTSSYYHIIEKHGYSKKIMDNTMRFYFIRKPKKLAKIYDKVFGILSRMQTDIQKEENLTFNHRDNLWKGSSLFCLPDPGGADSTRFEIPIKNTGVYLFSFSATLFPDDQSINPQVCAFVCNADSIDTGKKDYLKTINYLKDGQTHNYSVLIKVPANRTNVLKGNFYSSDNQPDETAQHARFNDISLSYLRPL